MPADAIDSTSFCLVKFGTDGATPKWTYIPLLRGSRMVNGPNLIPEYTAAGQFNAKSYYEPITWLQGLSTPALVIRTRAYFYADSYRGWFRAANLQKMLGAAPATGGFGTNRPVATGLIPSLGPVQWKYANCPTVGWKACWCAALSLTMTGLGRPIDVRMVLLPAEDEMSGTEITAATPTTATAYEPPTGLSAMHGQGMRFDTTLDRINFFQLSFGNDLSEDTATPALTGGTTEVAIPAPTDPILPNAYFNSMLGYGFTIEQMLSATKSGIPADLTADIGFTFDMAPPSDTGKKVSFFLKGFTPDITQDIGITIGSQRKSYYNVRSVLTDGSESLRISEVVA
jgi:hypothetical protein